PPRAPRPESPSSRFAFDVRFERAELAYPERFGPVEPRAQSRNRLRAQRVHAHARVELRMRLLDEPARAQDAQVAAERRRAQPHRCRQLARAARPFAQQVDDAAPMRFGDRRQRAIDRLGGYFQVGASIFSPLAVSASARETTRTVWANVHTWPSRSRA